jgi:SAM-dependent methyltransferase
MGSSITERYYATHHAGADRVARYGTTVGGSERVEWFARNVGRGRDVLDFGCRDGTLTSNFVEGNRVTGVDIDSSALARARESLGIETVQCNLNNDPLPFADASFDVVVAGEVIEHLQFPTIAVGELFRVLRPGGTFLGSVPNAFRLRNRITFLLGDEFELDPTHLHQFSEASVRRMLEPYGPTTIEYQGGRRMLGLAGPLASRTKVRRLFGATLLWRTTKA